MDRGFNDDELADIMSEIENLEQDFKEEPQVEAAQSIEETQVEEAPKEAAPVAEQEESSLEEEVSAAKQSEVLEELSEMSEEEVVPVQQHDAQVHQIHNAPASKTCGTNTSMSFQVSGDMAVQLSFNVSGHEIQLSVSEHEGLVIGMDSGAKFTVPFVTQQEEKKAS